MAVVKPRKRKAPPTPLLLFLVVAFLVICPIFFYLRCADAPAHAKELLELAEGSNINMICITTALYGANVSTFDRMEPPPDEFMDVPDFVFFAFTNNAAYHPPEPWHVINTANHTKLKHLKRYVTQSRYGKFLAWKEPQFSKCRAIFYFDGIYAIRSTPETFRHLAEMMELSSSGLMQFPHPFKRPSLQSEFDAVLAANKDSEENINASMRWLKERDDFQDRIQLYANNFFGYNPRSMLYRIVSQGFWDVYSQENQSIRDQPLWAYMLWHHHLAPLQFPFLDEDGRLYRTYPFNVGFGGHVGGQENTVQKKSNQFHPNGAQ